jgi:hypothetical protein
MTYYMYEQAGADSRGTSVPKMEPGGEYDVGHHSSRRERWTSKEGPPRRAGIRQRTDPYKPADLPGAGTSFHRACVAKMLLEGSTDDSRSLTIHPWAESTGRGADGTIGGS